MNNYYQVSVNDPHEVADVLLNRIPSEYISLSSSGVFENIDKVGTQILENEYSSFLNTHRMPFFAGDTRLLFIGLLIGVFSCGINVTCKVILASTGKTTVLVIVDGFRSVNGAHGLILLIDITGRRQADDLLNQTRLNYKTFFNTIDDCHFITDVMGNSGFAEDNYIDVNDVFLATLGYNLVQVIGKTSGELHHFADLEARHTIIEQLVNGITR